MNSLELTTNDHLICITIERQAVTPALVAQVEAYLQGFLVDSLPEPPITTAAILRRLPREERRRIMAEQFNNAASLYSEHPDALVEDASDWSEVYAR